MKISRRGRRDAAQKGIADGLRAIGWPFHDVSHLAGLGCDIITRHRDGSPRFLEVKNPKDPPSWSRLTESEEKLRDLAPGHFAVVRTIDETLAAIGIVKPGDTIEAA